MKMLLYADPHWSVTSSIVRSRGEKYSVRLENLIASIQWAENLAEKLGCEVVICLGDFFDTSQLNSEEISALGEIWWAHAKHYFLAGNHEMGRGDQSFSSSKVFDLCPQSYVITSPTSLPIYDQKDTRIVCIPYILEKDRKPLKEYLDNIKENLDVDNLIILSHNDIKGIQMGSFLSTSGFTVDEIQDSCKLFVNGHLHNGGVVAPGVINLGNLTGQNFSEDAYKYSHNVMIIDTETHEVDWIENPHALKFFKLDFTKLTDDSNIQKTLQELPANSVVTIKTIPENDSVVRDLLSTMNNIIESRVIIDMSGTVAATDNAELPISRDHFVRFSTFVTETLGNSDIIADELSYVCGGSS